MSCSSLTSFTIPENVETIGDYAFNGCTNLTQLTIESATVYQSATGRGSVGSALLNNNTRIYVPIDMVDKYDSTYLEDTNNYSRSISGNYYVFSKTLDFTFTTSGSNGTLIDYTGSATSVTIPKTFSLFNGVAFAGTDYTVTAIGINAFRDNSTLRFITIPDTVTSIGASAFYGCTNLDNVIIESPSVYQAVTNESACGGLISYATRITVPISIVESYYNSFLENGFSYSSSKNYTNYVFTKNSWQ